MNKERQLHCDRCGRPVGSYLYGKGGIEERAVIHGGTAISLPDITCYECLRRETPQRVIDEYKSRELRQMTQPIPVK